MLSKDWENESYTFQNVELLNFKNIKDGRSQSGDNDLLTLYWPL